MEIQFTRSAPCYDRLLFVLSLDRKRMKERILIGDAQQIRFRLEGSEDASVLYDVTRPLGTLLVDFEHDEDGTWNRLGLMPLHDALHTNRWMQPELERRSGDYLRGRFQSGDPVAVYLAARVWNGYLLAREPRDRDAACDRFMAEMSVLMAALHGERPLELDAETGRPRTIDLSARFYGHVPAADTQLDLWYPAGKRVTECVAAYASFYPLITYYLNRLNDWSLCFRRCKVCGRVFLAKSQRYELCSDKCRKAQALQNKRDFDERARENNYDLLYKNECQNWRNKINKAAKLDGFPPEQLAAMRTAFEAFKKEALERKRVVKQNAASPKEFSDWLYQQSNVIVGMLGDYA